MPMNKAERADMDALRVRCALSWPAPPPKPIDLAVAREAQEGEWVRAWWFNQHSGLVGEGVTNGHQHAREPYSDERLARRHDTRSRVSMSQTSGGPWFGSKADALAAMHFAVAEDCAKRLASIIKRIEEDQ